MYQAVLNAHGLAGGPVTHGALNATLAAGSSSILNIGWITSLLGTVLIAIVLVVAIRHAMHAHAGNWTAVLTGMGVLALAFMTWALATNHDFTKLGSDLVSHLLNL